MTKKLNYCIIHNHLLMETALPRYFNVEVLLRDYGIEDTTLLDNIKDLSDFSFELTEILQILLEKNIQNVELLNSVVDTLKAPLAQIYFKSLIELLASKNILDEDMLKQLIDFKEFKKVFIGYNQLKDVNLLNKQTCSQILVTDIEKQVQKLTQPFPLKKSYFYFLRNYSSPIKWGLGIGLGMGIGFYLLSSLKVLSLSALSAHPLIGIALISLSVTLLFILAKGCQIIACHTPNTQYLSS